MNKSLPTGLSNSLLWMPEKGYGWHPAEPMDYDEEYWQSYVERDTSSMGEWLTQARIEFVARHYDGRVVDIGIGGGKFVEDSKSYGFDVNKQAVAWLKKHKLFKDPYKDKVEAITCWDSIEHIPDPIALLNQVKQWVFMSIPIFANGEAVIHSKHYKPGEHIWYFTERGLIHWMADHGFMLIKHSNIESQLGREGIMTYAFRRQ